MFEEGDEDALSNGWWLLRQHLSHNQQIWKVIDILWKRRWSLPLSPCVSNHLLSVLSHSTSFIPPSVCYLQRRPSLTARGVRYGKDSFIGEENALHSMERKTPELSSWLRLPKIKPRIQSFLSWKFALLAWHKHADLWLHVSASEAALAPWWIETVWNPMYMGWLMIRLEFRDHNP